MDPFLREIEIKLGNTDDFFMKPDTLGDTPVVLLGLSSLVDIARTRQTMKTMGIFTDSAANPSAGELTASILRGKLIIYSVELQRCTIMDPVPKTVDRQVDFSSNENILQGGLNAFNEDLDTNLGIIRKELVSDQIRMQTYIVGKEQKKRLSLLYMEDTVDEKLIAKISTQIERKLNQEVHHQQDLCKLLGLSPWGLIPKFKTTEIPAEAAQCLAKGRVILFVDRLPFALVLPCLLWDMFIMENDRNYPLPIMIAIRTTRILGVLLTVLTPGLYVALVSVNPEVLRIELALSIAESRAGVPYPAMIEMIIMLVILELILEASVRLPRSVGPTITVVGGIILGQAVVQAKLVSNLLIIILAATTIANSTVVGFQNSLSIRFFKYLIVILAAIYGVLGILGGMMVVSAYLASINTFGMPYIHVKSRKGELQNG